MSRLFRDLPFGIRQLRKSPGFTVTILLTLGLCIGANTAIFSVVDAVFFRPLPYPDPGRLVMVVNYQSKGGASTSDTGQTGLQWELIRDHANHLESAVFPGGAGGVNLVANGRVEYIQQQRVSSNFFHVLGVRPLLGRSFTSAEDVEGGPNLTVLSYGLWRRMFNGDGKIVGKTVRLRGAPFTGVAAGLLLGLFAARVLKSMIWGISTGDPFTLGAVAIVLLLIGGLTSLVPALRLTSLDPAQTLRDE